MLALTDSMTLKKRAASPALRAFFKPVALARASLLVVADHFINDETQKLLAELWIKVRFFRKRTQPRNLPLLARGVCRRQRYLGLVFAHRLRDAKALCKHMNDRRIDIVDALTKTCEGHVIGWRVG